MKTPVEDAPHSDGGLPSRDDDVFFDEACARLGIEASEEAPAVCAKVVALFACALTGDERTRLAHSMPRALADSIEGAGALDRTRTTATIVAELAPWLETSTSRAHEVVTAVLELIGEHLPEPDRSRLLRALPSEFAWLLAPIDRRAHPARHTMRLARRARTTISEAQGGGEHPLHAAHERSDRPIASVRPAIAADAAEPSERGLDPLGRPASRPTTPRDRARSAAPRR